MSEEAKPLLVSVPVPGGVIRVSISSTFEPDAASSPAQAAASPQPEEDRATENQVRKIFAEMHRIGEDLAKAYMNGHFGTVNPKELHKKTASSLIKWLISQPSRKG